MQTLDLLRQARELIADPAHWAQGHWARLESGEETFVDDPEACSWCSAGALAKVDRSQAAEAMQHLELAIRQLHPDLPASDILLATFNDTHTHSEILAVFDKAILLCSPPN